MLSGMIGVAMQAHITQLWGIKVPYTMQLLPIAIASLAPLRVHLSRVNFSKFSKNICPPRVYTEMLFHKNAKMY